jgi:hypothetical protein
MNQTTSQSHDFANYSYGIKALGALMSTAKRITFSRMARKVFSRVS